MLGGRLSAAYRDRRLDQLVRRRRRELRSRQGLGRQWQLSPRLDEHAGHRASRENGRLATDAWAFDLAKSDAFRAGDWFALRVMQPLRVRSGGFDLNMPVSYDYADGSVGYERRFFNLAPTGREIDLEAAYGMRPWGGQLIGQRLLAHASPAISRRAETISARRCGSAWASRASCGKVGTGFPLKRCGNKGLEQRRDSEIASDDL